MRVSEGQVMIDGRWREAVGGALPVVNPSDGETFAEIARGGPAEVDAAVDAARRALESDWGRMPAFERGRILARLGQLISERVEELAALEARDVGKPLRQARADAVALARYFEFYGGAADKVHGQTIPYHAGYTVLTLREPHGVTGHIIPWNYPMQILGRSVGAALAMGNACVLKPGEDASLTALEVGRLAIEAGLPPGALNIVTGYGEEAGAALAAHPGIDHVSFTGSREVGCLVQQAAAKHTCPVTLELGGKSPQVVFADAELDQALLFVVNAAIQNAGQTCSAGSRLLVEDSAYDEFVGQLAERFHTIDVGPAERDLDCGPLINRQQLERVEGFLRRRTRTGCCASPRARSRPTPPKAASTSSRSCSARCRPTTSSPRTRSSGRCWWRSASRTRGRRSGSRTPPLTAWSPGCGPAMAVGSCASRARSGPARCSSTTTAPAAASSCRSGA